MAYKKMREYTHEEFVELVKSLSEEELLKLSANYGGYPVLFRMALDDRISHIPFIQTGAAIIIRNENGQILLQERTDRNKWGLPGGCQDLGEDLRFTAVREAYEETGIKLDPYNIELIDKISNEGEEEKMVDKLMIKSIIEDLPTRDKKIILLRLPRSRPCRGRDRPLPDCRRCACLRTWPGRHGRRSSWAFHAWGANPHARPR